MIMERLINVVLNVIEMLGMVLVLAGFAWCVALMFGLTDSGTTLAAVLVLAAGAALVIGSTGLMDYRNPEREEY